MLKNNDIHDKEFKIMSGERSSDRRFADRLDDLAAREDVRKVRPTSYWAGRLAALRENVEAARDEAVPTSEDLGQPSRSEQLLVRLRENVDTVNAGGESRGYADLIEPGPSSQPQHPLLLAMQQRIAASQAGEAQ